ncbi:PLD nuclease N-terminal domain-containing protein [Deinococcus planocerae]|uniref:PLD nuclease N-terminal domain-containing protein n=1 Tax=Deinococcus planocerae TaxID=1737569 RepID=UPI000C7E88B2|nr:PLD nuclease N-terminal domain-containing protein [Deinococcus planocerae]
MNEARPRRTWQDLSPGQRGAALVAGAVQLMLLIAAQRDLTRRPDDGVRGRKLWWRVVTFVNFVGPISYFLFRRVPAQRGASKRAA